MSARPHNLCVYGVELDYNDAVKVANHCGERVLLKEMQEFSLGKTEENWEIQWQKHEIHQAYKSIISGHQPEEVNHETYTNLFELLDAFDYCAKLIDKEDTIIEKHLLQKHVLSKKEYYYTQRYYSDVFVVDGAGYSSLRCQPKLKSIFGIFCWEELPYEYGKFREQNIQVQQSPRVSANFVKYCLPVLNHFNIEKEAEFFEFEQRK